MKNQKQIQQKAVNKLGRDVWRSRQIYLMILPAAIYFIIFEYWPLMELRVSFYDYNIFEGIEGSEFVGFENFIKLFKRRNFLQMMWNALSLNLLSLAIAFPAPIIFALMLNEMRFNKAKKVVQTVREPLNK